MRLPLRLARILAVSAPTLGVSGLFAVSGQPASFDQRFVFDPGISASSPSITEDATSGSKPQAESSEVIPHAAGGDWGGMVMPELNTGLPSVDIRWALKGRVGSDGAASAEPGGVGFHEFNLGNFSLGLDTTVGSMPRIPFAGDTNNKGYDTSYDPKHPYSLPFIGFSAKSILP